jgi:hypothetical protein
MAACAQSGEHAGVRAPASSEAEEAPARPIATSLASDPLQEQAPEQPAHESHAHHHEHGAGAGAGAAHESAQYSCPMHPEVQQAGPGECPKCGMRLVHKPSPQAEPAHEHAK